MWEEKSLQDIVNDVWPQGLGVKPDLNSSTSSLGMILTIVDVIVKQRIKEACEEPIET